MNNPRTYQALSVLGFIVSAIFTVRLFASNSTDLISWVAMIATALLYEFGKYTLLYQAIKGPFQNTGKLIMLGSWFFVTCASVFASATYVLNDANENKNMMVESSSSYQKQQDAIKLKKDLYSVKKKELENLEALKDKQRQDCENIVNSMPKDYIDRKNQQKRDTAAQITKTQDLISAKSAELSEISKELSSPSVPLQVETESTKGGASMFKLLAQKLNENPANKKNPYSAEEIGIYFYIAIGIGLELLANLFAFLSQYYSYGRFTTGFFSPEPEKMKKPPIENKSLNSSTLKEIQEGRLKGLTFRLKNGKKVPRPKKPLRPTHKENDLNNDSPKENNIISLENKKGQKTKDVKEGDIEKYLKFVRENLKVNGELPGRDKIAKGIKIHPEKCRTIHNILKSRGVIHTGNKRSWLADRVGEVV